MLVARNYIVRITLIIYRNKTDTNKTSFRNILHSPFSQKKKKKIQRQLPIYIETNLDTHSHLEINNGYELVPPSFFFEIWNHYFKYTLPQDSNVLLPLIESFVDDLNT